MPNIAPVADAGADFSAAISGGADLDGSATDDYLPIISTKDSSNCSAFTGWTKRNAEGDVVVDTGRFKFTPANGVTNGDLSTYRTTPTTGASLDVITCDWQVGADNNDTLYISLTDEARGPLNGTENMVAITIGGGGGVLGQRRLAGSSTIYPATRARNADPATIYNGKFVIALDGSVSLYYKESTESEYFPLGSVDTAFDFRIPLYFNVSGYRDASQTGLYFDNFIWGVSAPLSYSWSKVSGPGSVSFSDDTDPLAHAEFSAAGVYVLRLSVSDGDLTDTDDVTVTVTSVTGTMSRLPDYDNPSGTGFTYLKAGIP